MHTYIHTYMHAYIQLRNCKMKYQSENSAIFAIQDSLCDHSTIYVLCMYVCMYTCIRVGGSKLDLVQLPKSPCTLSTY